MEQIPQPHGGALNAGGVPGNKGGTGRPPDIFKRRMELLVLRAQTAASVEAVLDEPAHRHFPAVLNYATDRAFGRATERHEHSGPDGADIAVKVTQVWQFGDRKIEF